MSVVAGQMCVHLAAAAGHVDTLNTLAYYGADLNATVSTNTSCYTQAPTAPSNAIKKNNLES